MTRTLLACLIVLSATSYAFSASSESEMLRIESNYPKGYKAKITSYFQKRTTSIAGFVFTDNRDTKLKYTVEDLRKGVVLLRAFGNDIITLSSPDFTSEHGGKLIITFYRKFFSDDRRELHFHYLRNQSLNCSLKLAPNEDWTLFTDDPSGRDRFNELAAKVVTKLGTPTGIDVLNLSMDGRRVRQYETRDLPHPQNRFSRSPR
jgi:hypothetical protein